MRIVFVRHGERKGDGLTERGQQMCRRTGEWLRDQGVSPDLVVVTYKNRAAQTADALGLEARRAARPGLPRAEEGWAALISELEAEGAGTVVLVGHHPTQLLVEQQFGGAAFAVPSANRAAAFVLEKGDAGWACAAAWPGEPATGG